MNPLQKLQYIFSSKNSFEQAFLKKSARQLRDEGERMEKMQENKFFTEKQALKYSYSRSATYFIEYANTMLSKSAKRVEAKVISNPYGTENWDYIKECLKYGTQIFADIETLQKLYPKVPIKKIQKELEITSSCYENMGMSKIVSDTKSNSPFAADQFNTLVKFGDKVTSLKPDKDSSASLKQIYNFYSKGEILSYTLAACKRNIMFINNVLENILQEWKRVFDYSQKSEYVLGDYALFHYYLFRSGEGEGITNANKDRIAKRYNIRGKGLYEAFNKYRQPNARTETISSRSDTEKKERFKKVINLLQPYPQALKRAIDEQKIFITASESNYD